MLPDWFLTSILSLFEDAFFESFLDDSDVEDDEDVDILSFGRRCL
ncbi:protein of unknown function [Candidatus Nitrosocosmicus franklandus]|uniref:Uncharacterized protein n=1 Tax=Candidatus Nitrosocosmicus franklandianus TaxID=1798806 RepID=A0A484IAL4_9ARCH|nr:protein of unknown function [Candidatus Nitrosocosmicus franklandus]